MLCFLHDTTAVNQLVLRNAEDNQWKSISICVDDVNSVIAPFVLQ